MPGYVLNSGASGTCPHGGRATPPTGVARVRIAGLPVLTAATQMVVSQCVPPGGAPPCTVASFVSGASRVTVGGVPVALSDSVAFATGPVTLNNRQQRVRAQ